MRGTEVHVLVVDRRRDSHFQLKISYCYINSGLTVEKDHTTSGMNSTGLGKEILQAVLLIGSDAK